MDEGLINEIEQQLNQSLGIGKWGVYPYLSPAEKEINKPILPRTDPVTGKMGHVRNWVGPDTPLVQAKFKVDNGSEFTMVFKQIEEALAWLMKQNSSCSKPNY